jgi:hypothetical protein
MKLFTSGITLDELAISGILLVINSLILLFFYYKLQINSKKDNNFFNFFKGFVLFFGIFTIILSILTIAFPRSLFIAGQGYLIGHFFLYIACAYLVRVWLLIANPLFDSINVFKFYIIWGLAVTILNLYFFNYFLLDKDVIIPSLVKSVMSVTIIIIIILSFLPAAIIFIREAINQPRQRVRYSLIAASLMTIIVGGPLHNIKSFYLLADLITAIGFLLLFWGVMSGIKSETTIAKTVK